MPRTGHGGSKGSAGAKCAGIDVADVDFDWEIKGVVMQTAGNISELGQRAISVLHRSSRADVPNARFEQEFFGELRSLFNAEAVAVWFFPGGETLYLRHQQNVPTEELQRNIENWQRHGRLLMESARTGEPRIVPPDWASENSGNPTSSELLIAPAIVFGTQQIVLEIFRSPGEPKTEGGEASELTLLSRAAEFAADRARMGQLAGAARERVQWKSRDGFSQRVHGSLDPRKTAYVAANEGRDALGCDRVSVVLGNKRRARVEAVSGQPKPDRRANQVRLLESLTQAVLKAGEPVVLGPNARQCPAAAADWLTAYVADSKATTLFVVPFSINKNAPFGAIVVEQFDTKLTPETLVEGVNQVTGHVAVAMKNALDHDRMFLASLRRGIGNFFAETVRLRTLVWIGIITAVTTTLLYVPWELRLEGRGTMRADHRRGVFAPEAGVVREVHVTHGQKVEAGQKLAVIENTELQVLLQRAREQLVTVDKTLDIRTSQQSEKALNSKQRIEIDGEIAQLGERKAHLERTVALLDSRIAPLTLTAPMAGMIGTWQPDKQLLNRPVVAGNMLLNVIDESGPWTMELEVPEDDAGYIMEADRKRPEGTRLPVDYILATNPERRYKGWLKEMSPRTESVKDKHVVLMTIVPDPNDPPPLHDGAEVRGRIHCGERSLGYVMCRELIEFAYSRIVFLF